MTTEILVDGNGLVCRLWWANPANVPERFSRAIEQVKPPDWSCRVCVAWDSPSSWRRDLFPSYKSHRKAKPKALADALKACRGRFEDLEAPGFEADDCIATECRRALESGYFVVVMSDDKDMAQLVDHRCRWLAGGRLYDSQEVIAKFGVPPDRMRHLLSWMGDNADGLPGVAGHGKERAIAKALAGEIGNQMTYDLTELTNVPPTLMLRSATR